MINLHRVSYVRLGTRDLEGATRFAVDYLGLEIGERQQHAVSFRSDDRDCTLCYSEGDAADQVVAFEVLEKGDIEAAAAELEHLGCPVRLGTESEAAVRHVRDFIAFADPSGNAIELVYRPLQSPKRHHGSRDAGITGFSHVGLCSTDVVRDEAFWTLVCNARVSDRIGDAPLLRIDEVHHSIALFPSEIKGIQHINHQVESGNDVMRSYYFLKERSVRITFGPGRHPTSSARFLYFEGPEAMVFEYSSGVQLIADELLYREGQFPFEPRGFCQWGAIPRITQFQKDVKVK